MSIDGSENKLIGITRGLYGPHTGLAATSGPKRGLLPVEWVMKLFSKPKTALSECVGGSRAQHQARANWGRLGTCG